MDPVSGRMIGLRADMTPQVARIAATRLKKSARPLRLCYAGQVLRVRGSQLRPERQVGQVGAELIGSDSVAADVEAVAIAAEALASLGIIGLTVDLTLPTLVPAVCGAFKLGPDAVLAVRRALDHKDAAALKAAAGKAAPLLGDLLKAAGESAKSLKVLAALDLPKDAAAERARLGAVVGRLKSAVPGLGVTIDPVENRGFEYHTGISFTFFTPTVRGELGRGGRYRTDNGGGEEATGFTLYTDTVLQAVPGAAPAKRIYLPEGADPAVARGLREQGWVTVAALAPAKDKRAEAKRLGCGHLLENGKPIALS
jgi:ATP phosphoribosyltransferase regulatory subunit